MKRYGVVTLAAGIFVLVLTLSAAAAGGSGGPSFPSSSDRQYVEGQVLVGFQPGTSAAEQQQVENDVQGEQVGTVGAGTRVLRIATGQVQEKIAQLRQHASVRYAEPNYILHADTVPNDPSFGQLYGLRNTGQSILGVAGTAGADIKAEPAWTVTQGSNNVVVGVVDTGIDYNHPDLAANVWSNPGTIGGCAAGTHGFNAITNTCNPLDDNDHGSHVSGTIGATGNNGVGVVGVNWNVKIMGLKFLDASGSGSTAGAISAIDFAVNAKIAGVNVRVLSNSWGGGGFSQALLDEINKANANDILFVAAAGNNGTNNNTTPHYPSSYNAPNMVSVAATDNRDALASWSNYGSTSVNLGAPGVDILSTTRNNTYSYFSGTSMATPHVSGAAALILSVTPTLTVAQLKSTILNNVDPIPSLAGKTTTGGRLNVCKAIPGCGGPPPPPPPPDYSLSATPASQSAVQGSSTTYTVNITRMNFVDAVTLGASGLPSGAAATFSPNPATANSATMTVTTSTTTPTGSSVVTITGNSGALSRTASVTLVVNPPASPNFTLSATPTSRTITRGASTSYTVNITRTGGFTGAVTFSVSGLGIGQTSTFSPNPATGASSTLTVATTATAATGSRVLTITGTGGSLSRTTSVTLVVNAPAGGCQGQCQG
ncbi:MAG TPA: S8 family peptidase [Gaiellaceae bacterium]